MIESDFGKPSPRLYRREKMEKEKILLFHIPQLHNFEVFYKLRSFVTNNRKNQHLTRGLGELQGQECLLSVTLVNMATSGESGRDRTEVVNSKQNHWTLPFVSREPHGRGYQNVSGITFISRGILFLKVSRRKPSSPSD